MKKNGKERGLSGRERSIQAGTEALRLHNERVKKGEISESKQRRRRNIDEMCASLRLKNVTARDNRNAAKAANEYFRTKLEQFGGREEIDIGVLSLLRNQRSLLLYITLAEIEGVKSGLLNKAREPNRLAGLLVRWVNSFRQGEKQLGDILKTFSIGKGQKSNLEAALEKYEHGDEGDEGGDEQ